MDAEFKIKSSLLKQPRLKYCYSAQFIDDDKVLLLSEKDNVLLTGKLYCDVLRSLCEDGVTLETLLSRLGGDYSIFRITAALKRLEKDGYITESVPSLPPAVSAYWDSIGIHHGSLIEILAEKSISVECLGKAKREILIRPFRSIGLEINQTGRLRVVFTDDYERKELLEINREAISIQKPWLLVKPYGVELWIGPLFIPGRTGCWECLRQRLMNNRPMNVFFRSQKNTMESPPLPLANLPLTVQVAVDLSALEVTKWLYFGENERLEGKIVTFDTLSLELRLHELVKRPQCPVCGDEQFKNSQPPSPIVLKKRSSSCITTRGGYREVSLEDTFEKYRHHISPITGVVQWLRPYYPVDGAPIYNYSSGLNVALRSKNMFWLNYHIRGANGGKGSSRQQAKTGALCEAIERYSCTYQGNEYSVTGSLREWGEDAVHPNACMNFSEEQYRTREKANKDCRKFYLLVPRPLDENLSIPWTPVYSLTRRKFKYLPSCFCYAQFPAEDELNLIAYPDSNGCAAGNSIEEAILQGFLELVERDSAALWWYNKLHKPAVDLTSFKDPYFDRIIQHYKSLDRGLNVLDLTADLRIPVFAAVSHRLHGDEQEIIFGFGAHVDAKIAIERALVELNQLLPVVQAPLDGRNQGKYRTRDDRFIHWLNTATLGNQPYLVPDENLPARRTADYPSLCPATILDGLEFCLSSAINRGLETLVLDMTRPDVELPVVKVIVPGMRHFWRRLAPGRLYDIPVEMGWLSQPLREEELNPIALFI